MKAINTRAIWVDSPRSRASATATSISRVLLATSCKIRQEGRKSFKSGDWPFERIHLLDKFCAKMLQQLTLSIGLAHVRVYTRTGNVKGDGDIVCRCGSFDGRVPD